MAQVIGKQIIGNNFSALSESSFQAMNPVTGQALDHPIRPATQQEVDLAALLAENAFIAYRKLDHLRRASFLEAIAEEIEQLGDVLVETAMAETALPMARLQGERGRTTGQLRLFASLLREGSWVQARIDTALPDRQPLPRPDIRMMQVPIGPVAVFGASNFPLAFSVAGGDTASALAAGCPVIVKAHPAHPGTSDLVGQAIQRAAEKTGMPEGVFSLLQDNGFEVGQALVMHPSVKAVGFTGSFNGGMALYRLARQRTEPIPVYAEMGSTNPVFVLPGTMEANGEEIARSFAASVTLGVGQFCTNPGLLFLLKNESSGQFLQQLNTAFQSAQGGVMLTAGILKAYESGLDGLQGGSGVEVLATGNKPQPANTATPFLFRTTGRQFLASAALGNEVFGPCSLVVELADEAECREVAQSLVGQLTASVHGLPDELKGAADLLEILQQKAGRVLVNGFPTGVEVCHAMVHGGPYPATTAAGSSSVGTWAIYRFTRPVCFQNYPDELLPEALRQQNPLGIMRWVNGVPTRD